MAPCNPVKNKKKKNNGGKSKERIKRKEKKRKEKPGSAHSLRSLLIIPTSVDCNMNMVMKSSRFSSCLYNLLAYYPLAF